MNLSRAYTLAYGDELSVGRVQTPTLAMVVERELAIRRFVPEDYLEVVAEFRPRDKPGAEAIQGTWVRDVEDIQKSARLPADGVEAAQIVARARTGKAAIESVKAETQRMGPPPLYDLTELQRHANRLFGFSAQKTLDIAQVLYERHKLISYPRTDSRHLVAGCGVDAAADCAGDRRALSGTSRAGHRREAAGPAVCGRCESQRSPRDYSDGHFAGSRQTSSPDEQKIYDLICRRLLSAWHEDHIWSVTTVITAIANGAVDRSLSFFRQDDPAGGVEGARYPDAPRTTQAEEEQALPPGLAQGQAQEVLERRKREEENARAEAADRRLRC